MKQQIPGCLCCTTAPPPNCTSPLFIRASEACYGFVGGVTITVKNNATGVVVATCTTNSSGICTVFVPTGTYRVSADSGGIAPTGSSGGSAISGSVDRLATCSSSINFTFPAIRFKATVIGCSGGLPGATVTLKRAGITIGSGASDSAGLADFLLSSPNATGADLTIEVSMPPYFHDYKITLPQSSAVICSRTIPMAPSGTNGDGSPRGVNYPTYGCCGFRPLPLPGTLNGSIGGESVTLVLDFPGDATGAWGGTISKTYDGIARLPGGGYLCSQDPLTPVSIAFIVSWRCDQIVVTYGSCELGSEKVGVESSYAEFLAGTTPETSSSTGGETSNSIDPMVSTGTFSHSRGYLAGPWTVSE